MDNSKIDRSNTEGAFLECTRPYAEDLGVEQDSVIDPEWAGDIRDPSAGCWHLVNGNWVSTTADADYCRKPCVTGTRYCEQHQLAAKPQE